jgi:S-DNA-T family DNA segregation ATPase FtsK/SpoIIIE
LRRLAAHSAVRVVAGPAPDPAEVAGPLAAGSGPVVVLVDDVDLLGFGSPLEPVLWEIVATGRDRGVGLAYAAARNAGAGDQRMAGGFCWPRKARWSDLLGTRVPPNLLRGGIAPDAGTSPTQPPARSAQW